VSAGGQRLDRPSGAPSQQVQDERQRGFEVAGSEEDGPQNGLAVRHPSQDATAARQVKKKRGGVPTPAVKRALFA
jgi:hypothetical protein